MFLKPLQREADFQFCPYFCTLLSHLCEPSADGEQSACLAFEVVAGAKEVRNVMLHAVISKILLLDLRVIYVRVLWATIKLILSLQGGPRGGPNVASEVEGTCKFR